MRLAPSAFNSAVATTSPSGYADGCLSDYIRRLLTGHGCRYHQHYHSSGHVYQGRFRSFPIQQDDAALVRNARDWPWSNAAPARGAPPLNPGSVRRPVDWLEYMDAPQTEGEADAVRERIRRRRLFGDSAWMEGVARPLGLKASLRPRGRPRKKIACPHSLFESGTGQNQFTPSLPFL